MTAYGSEIDSLVQQFDTAEILIAGILAGVGAQATSSQMTQAQQQVAAILQELISIASRWVEENAPRIYRDGMLSAARSMALQTPERAVQRMLEESRERHEAALQGLAEDLVGDMAKATTHMQEDAKKRLREIGRRQLQSALEQKSPMAAVSETRKQLEEISPEVRGEVSALVDRRGRRWTPRVYAETVLLTQVASILNAGSLLAATEMGSPGVRVSDGGPGDVDDPCKRANGESWSIGYAMNHLLEHPRCRRSFAALPTTWRGELDRVEEVVA